MTQRAIETRSAAAGTRSSTIGAAVRSPEPRPAPGPRWALTAATNARFWTGTKPAPLLGLELGLDRLLGRFRLGARLGFSGWPCCDQSNGAIETQVRAFDLALAGMFEVWSARWLELGVDLSAGAELLLTESQVSDAIFAGTGTPVSDSSVIGIVGAGVDLAIPVSRTWQIYARGGARLNLGAPSFAPPPAFTEVAAPLEVGVIAADVHLGARAIFF